MKNFFVLLMIVTTIFAFGACACAATHDFDGWFSIDVPAGWSIEGSGVDMFVSIASPDGVDSITFEYAGAEGMDSHQFAEYASGILGGDSIVVETDFGDFEFALQNGSKAHALMIGNVGIVMSSAHGFDNLHSILETFVGR